jgi:hypothetical protein
MNKSPLYTLRASAVLTAAGAYDTPTKFDVPLASRAEVAITYTRGASGGAFKLKVLVSQDGTNFVERTVIDSGSMSSGVLNVFTGEFKFPVTSSGSAESRSFILDLSTCVAFKVSFAEYGVTGTPGTLSATMMMGA